MAKSIPPSSWKNGFREPGKGTPWVIEGRHDVGEEEEQHYITPPSSEILTSTTHNDLGLNVLRTWPTICDGTKSPHGVPDWWSPRSEVDVLICGAGPSGLQVALSLARQGVSFRIIDKGSAPLIIHELTYAQSLSWLPVDLAAQSISDILLGPTSKNLVYHIENPVRQSWPDLLSIVERNFHIHPNNQLPFGNWLKEAVRKNKCPESLLDFLRDHFLHMSSGDLVLDTRKSRGISRTLASVGTIGKDTVDFYIDFWKRIGFLT